MSVSAPRIRFWQPRVLRMSLAIFGALPFFRSVPMLPVDFCDSLLPPEQYGGSVSRISGLLPSSSRARSSGRVQSPQRTRCRPRIQRSPYCVTGRQVKIELKVVSKNSEAAQEIEANDLSKINFAIQYE